MKRYIKVAKATFTFFVVASILATIIVVMANVFELVEALINFMKSDNSLMAITNGLLAVLVMYIWKQKKKGVIVEIIMILLGVISYILADCVIWHNIEVFEILFPERVTLFYMLAGVGASTILYLLIVGGEYLRRTSSKKRKK